jgi:hypothetical protein
VGGDGRHGGRSGLPHDRADGRPALARGAQSDRGVAPLTDRDRAEIRKNIDRSVLREEPIAFRSTGAQRSVRPARRRPPRTRVISAIPEPLPPSSSRMSREPSAKS